MPGKESRARRVQATRQAKADVYANRGAAMTRNPYTDDRMARIYARSYESLRAHYWRMGSVADDLRQVCGWP
jgi:hypothetical protein